MAPSPDAPEPAPASARAAVQQPSGAGIALVLGCYTLWGVFPLYFRLLAEAGSVEIIGHRIVWTLATCLGLVAVRRRWGRLRRILRSARLLGADIAEDGANEIARRSRGTPRIANRLLRRVRDYAEIRADGRITGRVADDALGMLDVDPIGLDIMDRKLLEAIIERFGGGPVGLDNIAAAIGEVRDTIEDVIEPYLIQQGLLQRTPRGRMVTATTWEHFGLPVPTAQRGASETED